MDARLVTTTWEQEQLKQKTMSCHFEEDLENQELNLINLYPQMKYQEIQGFGGAITEAVGITLEEMGSENARQIMEAYFGKKSGNRYNLIRTPIDGCDFSVRTYESMSNPEDCDMESFTMERQERYIIPYIKMAYAAAGEKLPVMLSPWSPPAFMKTNESRRDGGRLKKEYYPFWSRYICRYLKEYQKHGIEVTSLSVQNEPNATQVWDSCLFTAEEEKEFLSTHLKPLLEKEGFGDVGIYIWDHNKERLFERACEEIDDETDNQIEGLAFHWYSGDHFDALRLVREKYPDKKLVFSEGCIEYSRFDKNQLKNAQMYGHDMIGNLKAGMNGFYDWNIVLNENGGPNYAGNFCESPIMCDRKERTWDYKLSYYYIQHFSRYIHPGARQIALTCYTDKLEAAAFENPGGELAVVLLNRTDGCQEGIIRLEERLLKLKINPNSIGTLLINREAKKSSKNLKNY